MTRKIIKQLLFTLLLIWLAGYGLFVMGVLNKTPEKIENKRPHAIIILTGGNNRITTGLTLFSKHKADKLFITGVNATVQDADINAIWKGSAPLPCCIELGRKAKTTRENALETKEWIKKKIVSSIILVTSDYHMDRAVQEFKSSIPALKIYKHPVKEQKYSITHSQFWKLTFSEYNKIIFRKIVLTLSKKG